MLLQRVKLIHSPVLPSGVVHLNTVCQVSQSIIKCSYVFFGAGLAPPPPNDICERTIEKRQETNINRRITLEFYMTVRKSGCACITGLGQVNVYSRAQNHLVMSLAAFIRGERVVHCQTEMTIQRTDCPRRNIQSFGKTKPDYHL